MATMIEIPMEEFSALREQINHLKSDNTRLTTENKSLKEKTANLEEDLDTIKNLQFFERLFHWNSFIN